MPDFTTSFPTLGDQDRSSNPALTFPCLDAIESRSASLNASRKGSQAPSGETGAEPLYTIGSTLKFHSSEPLELDWGGVLPEFDIAFETWGQLNSDRSNAVLLHTGLSASSHARSTADNPSPGWWEKFVGPGASIDTDRFHVICTNVIGGCYGSTGPGSIDPADSRRYGTRFPILTIEDMIRAQFRLLDHLGIDRLHASVGGSLGGMQSLAAGALFTSRVGRVVSISGCARSHPYSIALWYAQRQVVMMDPHWRRGFYYDDVPPHAGMKVARQIGTVTFRSGSEWEQRFGRRRADPTQLPALCPDFLIETYLDHSGEKFCLTYDANSLLYLSKAMDLFDLGIANQQATAARRADRQKLRESSPEAPMATAKCGLTPPTVPFQEQPAEQALEAAGPEPASSDRSSPPEDLVAGLAVLRHMPTLIMGMASDIHFPVWQQREVAAALRLAGNERVEHCELTEDMSHFGHDTFLLDLRYVGAKLGEFLNR